MGSNGSGTPRRKARGDHGATLVEFAIIAPLLFLLLFGVIEFGRVIATYTGVMTAAREGARYGSTVGDSPTTPGLPRYLDCQGIRSAAMARAVLVPLQDSDITVTYDTGPSGSQVADCQGGTPPTDALVQAGTRIRVTVNTTFDSPIPVISNVLGTLDVDANQARTLFRGTING